MRVRISGTMMNFKITFFDSNSHFSNLNSCELYRYGTYEHFFAIVLIIFVYFLI